MDTSALKVLASVQKTFGKEGELLIKFNAAVSDVVIDALNKTEPVFMVIDQIPVPFYFETIQPKGASKSIVRFENFLSEVLASEFVGRTLFYSISDQKSEELQLTEAELWDELLVDPSLLTGFSFTAVTSDGQHVSGTISDAFDYPNNPCIEITPAHATSGTLLPCHPEFFKHINLKKRSVQLLLPAGLLLINATAALAQPSSPNKSASSEK